MAFSSFFGKILRRFSSVRDSDDSELLNKWHEVSPLISFERCVCRCSRSLKNELAEQSNAASGSNTKSPGSSPNSGRKDKDVSSLLEPSAKKLKKSVRNDCGEEKRKKKRRCVCPESELELGILGGQIKEPLARSGHRIWADDFYLYSIGGYNPDRDRLPDNDLFDDFDELSEVSERPLLREVWRLNLLTDCWQEIKTTGTFPKQVASFAIIPDTTYGRLIVFGGTAIPFGNTATNSLHALALCGPNRGHWNRLKCANPNFAPIQGYGQAVTTVKTNSLYVVGGTTGYEYNMRVHKLEFLRPEPPARIPGLQYSKDTGRNVAAGIFISGRIKADSDIEMESSGTDEEGEDENCSSVSEGEEDNLYAVQSEEDVGSGEISWTPILKGPECPSRYRHEVSEFDGKIFVFGGGTRDVTYGFDNLDVFCLKSSKWTTVATVPDASHGFPNARRCHGFAEFENEVFIFGGFDGTRLFSDTWAFSLQNLRWRKLTNLPQPLYFHGSTVTPEGCLYSFGGVIDQYGQKRTNKTYRMWLRPPSLQWTAVRSLMKLVPEMSELTKGKIQAFGIPRGLVDYMSNADLAA